MPLYIEQIHEVIKYNTHRYYLYCLFIYCFIVVTKQITTSHFCLSTRYFTFIIIILSTVCMPHLLEYVYSIDKSITVVLFTFNPFPYSFFSFLIKLCFVIFMLLYILFILVKAAFITYKPRERLLDQKEYIFIIFVIII